METEGWNRLDVSSKLIRRMRLKCSDLDGSLGTFCRSCVLGEEEGEGGCMSATS